MLGSGVGVSSEGVAGLLYLGRTIKSRSGLSWGFLSGSASSTIGVGLKWRDDPFARRATELREKDFFGERGERGKGSSGALSKGWIFEPESKPADRKSVV